MIWARQQRGYSMSGTMVYARPPCLSVMCLRFSVCCFQLMSSHKHPVVVPVTPALSLSLFLNQLSLLCLNAPIVEEAVLIQPPAC